MLPIKPGAPVQGNAEVIEILTNWLDRAKLGKVNFVGVVACEGPCVVFEDHAGIPESYFAACFGLDHLKARLTEILTIGRGRAEVSEGPADHVVYDLSLEPVSFDFLVWLLTAELYRRRDKVPGPLKVSFLREDYPVDWHLDFYKNVMIPAVALMGGVIVPPVKGARQIKHYTCLELVRAARAGEEITGYVLPPGKPNGLITITLREAKHWPHRNSNLPEWFKFADYLKAQGENVVFIRDTDKADEPLPAPYEILPEASRDLKARLELYQNAKCNLFVPNGPMTLCQFGIAPWVLFWKPDSMDPYTPNTPHWMKEFTEIAEGDQFPWSGPHQQIAWTTDEFDNIKAAWIEWNNTHAGV